MPVKSHKISGPYVRLRAHNPKVVSSNLTPATNLRSFGPEPRIFIFCEKSRSGRNTPRPTYQKAERGAPGNQALGRHCPHPGWNQLALEFPNKSERIRFDST